MNLKTICAILAIWMASILPAAVLAADGPDLHVTKGMVLRGQFVQERYLKGFDAPLRSEGHFVLAPDHGLIWQADKPFAIRTVITPAGLVQQVAGKQTMHLEAERIPFMTHLYQMLDGALAGDWHALDGDFTMTSTSDGGLWHMVLTPRQAPSATGMPFSSIAIDGDRFVEQVTMSKSGGDRDVLRFSAQQLGQAPLTAEEAAAMAPSAE